MLLTPISPTSWTAANTFIGLLSMGFSQFHLPEPLFSPHENALNPQFVNLVIIAFCGVAAVFGTIEIITLRFFNSFGPHPIKYSFGTFGDAGLTAHFRLLSVLAELAVAAALGHYNQQNTLITIAAVIAFIVLPLHVIEPTRKIVQSSTILIFWLGIAILASVVVAQDFSSQIKIVNVHNSPITRILEIVFLLNSVSISAQECLLWKPSRELVDYFHLNGWDARATHNLLTQLSFSWVQPYIDEIKRKDAVEIKDLPAPLPDLTAASTLGQLEPNWQAQLARFKLSAKPPRLFSPSLFLALGSTFFNMLLISLCYSLVQSGLGVLQPFVLQKFLAFFTNTLNEEDTPPIIVGYFYASAMFLVALTRFLCQNQSSYVKSKLSLLINASLTSLVFNKSLRLSPQSRKGKSTGDIINLITMDKDIISMSFSGLESILVGPLMLVFCLLALTKIIKKATWGGVIIAVLMIPATTGVTTIMFTTFKRLLKYKDERVSLTTEILNSIKSIKFYSWESAMLERLRHVREDKELNETKKVGIFSAFITFVFSSIPFFISCASYAMFAYIYDIPLTPELIFPPLTLFNLLNSAFMMIPQALVVTAQAKTSYDRVVAFLLLDELQNSLIDQSVKSLLPGQESILCQNAEFVWTKHSSSSNRDDEESNIEHLSEDRALDIDFFAARKAHLTCIVGKVGSGKTTLLRALIGELELKTGVNSKVQVSGSMAYCSQDPWIVNATVKDNILFGCKYDMSWYTKTVEACELLSDFSNLPDGDKTIVGEKGISLSGGQKARISLARAVYANADIYLLDDVLSAVDAHVGSAIIQKVLSRNQGIIANKTIILATNSVPVLNEANEIYLLEGGRIIEKGNIKSVSGDGSKLDELIFEFSHKDKNNSNLKPAPVLRLDDLHSKDKDEDFEVENFFPLQKVNTKDTIGATSLVSFEDRCGRADSISSSERKTGNTEEESSKGTVKWSALSQYLRASKYQYSIFYVILVSASIGTSVLRQYVLTVWADTNQRHGETMHPTFYLGLYAAFGIVGGLFIFLASYVVWNFCIIKGSAEFHKRLASAVLRSPMSFFETTPVGRVLNRFGDDISSIDTVLPWTMMMFLMLCISAISTFAVIIYNIPLMFFVLAVLLVAYEFIRRYFITASRELKRLQSKSHSPVLSHIQESINGSSTIRAYNQVDRFVFKGTKNVDNLTSVSFLNQCCNVWLSVRLESLSATILLFSSLMAIGTLYTKSPLSPALIGFVLNYAFSITDVLNGIISVWTSVEVQSVAVERLVEYFNLTPEADMIVEDNRPIETWPSRGEIRFVNYETKYRSNLDPVLININIEIGPEEKIGVVGRTGAGKSTLSLSLFRIIEATKGYIEIDGIDISKIGLYDLRRKLSIIPQDSQTVHGSVRENLDPFGQHSNEQLWKVLGLAHLKDHVEKMRTGDSETFKSAGTDSHGSFGLDAVISENGSNLSAGQKQLLCLARALLNPSKVLILDEATASVDRQTDKIIHETIKSEFKDRTILTIAHRLETIMDSDRVLVLDHGRVKEFDSPKNLLANQLGLFYSLCKTGGQLATKVDAE